MTVLLDLVRKYRVIREPIRMAVGRVDAWLRIRREPKPSWVPEMPRDHAPSFISSRDEGNVLRAYDDVSRRWVLNVLQRPDLRSAFPSEDPEARHDVVRMRGVLPALARLLVATHSTGIAERIDLLLRSTARLVDSDRHTGWDATNAALRLLSLLDAEEILGPSGLSLLVDGSPWIRDFIIAHGGVLDVGRITEPEGNHCLINVIGRAAHQLLVRSDLPLPQRLTEEIVRTLTRQFLPDGGHVERSPHYHVQTSRIASLVGKADERRGGNLAVRIAPQVLQSGRALGIMLSPTGVPARFGDISRTFSGRHVRFDVSETLDATRGGVDGTLPDFGLAQLRWGDEPRFSVVLDFGPLGLEANPGHGHADMLSFCFWVDDHELITDPGTFLYANRPDAIEFKLRRVHNCVDWPEHDSGRSSRYFRWRHVPPPARLVGPAPPPPARSCVSAEHAWRRGSRRFLHRRTWVPLRTGLAILDEVRSSSPEMAIARLNLHPDSRAVISGSRTASLSFAGRTAAVSIIGASQLKIGDGWHAPVYGVRVPAPFLSLSFQSGPWPTTTQTVIRMSS